MLRVGMVAAVCAAGMAAFLYGCGGGGSDDGGSNTTTGTSTGTNATTGTTGSTSGSGLFMRSISPTAATVTTTASGYEFNISGGGFTTSTPRPTVFFGTRAVVAQAVPDNGATVNVVLPGEDARALVAGLSPGESTVVAIRAYSNNAEATQPTPSLAITLTRGQ
jgi:hypothetical protein